MLRSGWDSPIEQHVYTTGPNMMKLWWRGSELDNDTEVWEHVIMGVSLDKVKSAYPFTYSVEVLPLVDINPLRKVS